MAAEPSTITTFIKESAGILTAAALFVAALGAAWSKINTKLDATQKAVDGTVSEYKLALAKMGALETEIAELKANKAGIEEGSIKEKLIQATQASAIADAKALPETDAHVINGKPEKQIDRMEQTGENTNKRAENIETHVVKRVERVEGKLEEKKDK